MTILTMQQAREAFPLWFKPATMRFFRSRVGRTLYAGGYFVSSEQFVDSRGWKAPRKYSVRQVTEHGIDTVGEFQTYDTAREAIAAIRTLQRAL